MAGSTFQTNPIDLDQLLNECHQGIIAGRLGEAGSKLGRGSKGAVADRMIRPVNR